jgi:large subunit ribosomal protein L25
MPSISLQTSPRTTLGKKNKALRRSGHTPLHLYGPGGDPVILQAATPVVQRLVKSAGRTTPVVVTVDGSDSETLSFLREVAVHPVTGEIQHVDLLRIDARRKVEVPVEVVLIGEAPAVRGGEAEINQVSRTLMVLAFPLSVPALIEVDVSSLAEVGDVIRVGDLALAEDVEAAIGEDEVIVRAQRQREAEVFEVVGGEAEEGEEGDEDGEGAEGEEGEDADGESSEDEA